MAAFSALRLAKFNLDERQHLGFIGMPTPANAIFWGALISSCEAWLRGPHFNAAFLFAFMLLSCWLLICEVPMFALKFKTYAWAENKQKYTFLLIVLLILSGSAIVGGTQGTLWQSLSRGVAASIGVYVMMGIVASYLPARDE
jgi:CDP-diacylglycerol--serine O-phosphatidyltransferase